MKNSKLCTVVGQFESNGKIALQALSYISLQMKLVSLFLNFVPDPLDSLTFYLDISL